MTELSQSTGIGYGAIRSEGVITPGTLQGYLAAEVDAVASALGMACDGTGDHDHGKIPEFR